MLSSIRLLSLACLTVFGVFGDSEVCTDVTDEGVRVCYVIGTTRVTWFQAARKCSDHSHGKLITFDSPDQLAQFVDLVKQNSAVVQNLQYYVGGVEIGDSWRWTTNYTPIGQGYWAEGEPNNWLGEGEHCAAMYMRSSSTVNEGQVGKLNDVPCTHRARYICIVKTPLNPTTVPPATASPPTPQPQEAACCANCLNFNFMDCFSGGGNNPEYHWWMAYKPYGSNNGGNPYQNGGNPYQNDGNPYQNGGNPYQNDGNPYQNGGNPYQTDGNPYQTDGNPYQNGGNPYQNGGNPYETVDNMNSNGNGENPYQMDGNAGNPYQTDGNGGNPYQTDGNAGNPYQTDENAGNPYQTDGNGGNPYQTDENGGNPYQTGNNINSLDGNPYQVGGNGGNPYQTDGNPYQTGGNGENPYQTGGNGENPYQTGNNINANGGNPYETEEEGGYNPYPDMDVNAGNPYQSK